MKSNAWPQEVTDRMLELYAQGLSYGDISFKLCSEFRKYQHKFSFTRSAVGGKISRQRYGSANNRRNKKLVWPEEMIAKLRHYLDNGFDYDRSASKLKAEFQAAHPYISYSPAAIGGQARRLGYRTARVLRERKAGTARRNRKSSIPAVNVSSPLPYYPVDAATIVEPVCCTLDERDKHGPSCAWPINDGRPFRFCGNVISAQSGIDEDLRLQYCDYHLGLRRAP